MVISRKISFEKSFVIILLSLILLSGDFISSGIAFIAACLLIALLIIRNPKISSDELKLMIPLVVILLTGLAGSLIHGNITEPGRFYLIGKDIWYYLKPIIYILTGLYVYRMKMKTEVFLSLVLYISLLISIHHIFRVIVFIATAPQSSLVLDIIRYKTGPGNLLEAFSLAYVILLLRSSEVRKHLIFPGWFFIIIITVSIILSFSRTVFISFLISLVAMHNFFSFKVKIFIKSLIIVAAVMLITILGLLYLHKVSDRDSVLYDLTDKYLNSFKEITYEKVNPTFKEVNENWRGLETGKARSEIRKGSLLEKLFGFGFGKTVYIGYSGLLGIDDPNIPKFHNGFIEILLKTGYFGILFYILYFYFVFRIADRDVSGHDTDKLLKSIIVTSFLVTIVITGLYNKSALDPGCLITGYLLGNSLDRIKSGDKN